MKQYSNPVQCKYCGKPGAYLRTHRGKLAECWTYYCDSCNFGDEYPVWDVVSIHHTYTKTKRASNYRNLDQSGIEFLRGNHIKERVISTPDGSMLVTEPDYMRNNNILLEAIDWKS